MSGFPQSHLSSELQSGSPAAQRHVGSLVLGVFGVFGVFGGRARAIATRP
jgi:hypothetical protein